MDTINIICIVLSGIASLFLLLKWIANPKNKRYPRIMLLNIIAVILNSIVLTL